MCSLVVMRRNGFHAEGCVHLGQKGVRDTLRLSFRWMLSY
jgi:hypothetical protein